jgi:Lar family restriction alleviation protein
MKKLKPCPFCGEYPEMSFEVIDEDINGQTYNCYTVMCVNEDCHLSIVTVKDNEDDAIEAWNRRKNEESKILQEEHLLRDYSEWLEDIGYLDYRWHSNPTTIERFLVKKYESQ